MLMHALSKAIGFGDSVLSFEVRHQLFELLNTTAQII